MNIFDIAIKCYNAAKSADEPINPCEALVQASTKCLETYMGFAEAEEENMTKLGPFGTWIEPSVIHEAISVIKFVETHSPTGRKYSFLTNSFELPKEKSK